MRGTKIGNGSLGVNAEDGNEKTALLAGSKYTLQPTGKCHQLARCYISGGTINEPFHHSKRPA